MTLKRKLLIVSGAVFALGMVAVVLMLLTPVRCLGCWAAFVTDAGKMKIEGSELIDPIRISPRQGHLSISNRSDLSDAEVRDVTRLALERIRSTSAYGQDKWPKADDIDVLFVGADHPVSYGSTHFSPLGHPMVVIGPKGSNIDVVAHELAHALQFKSVGFISFETAYPTWFIEGHAMQMDYRPAYGREGLCALLEGLGQPTLETLMDPGQFYDGKGVEGQVTLNYAFAKAVVQDFIERFGAVAFHGFEYLERDFYQHYGEKSGYDPCARKPS